MKETDPSAKMPPQKGLLTFDIGVKLLFAQSAARHPKIAQSHKSHNNAHKFQLFSVAIP
jgi:hypothetical protein